MSAFEDFIQLEIPKRPYLDTDAALESVMVRRGVGPRQLQPVSLTEGQVLALVGGVLTGTAVTAIGGGVRKAILAVTAASDTWTITHNLGSENAIIQVVDSTGNVMIPGNIQITSVNEIVISFNTAVTGTARAIFLD